MSINHDMIFPKAMKKHNDNPFAKPQTIFVYGSKGSGKTTLVANILMLIEKAIDIEEDDAIFVTGNSRDPLLKALNFPITDSPTDLDEFMLKVKNNKDTKKNFLIVLDDLQSHPSFKLMSSRSSVFTSFVLSSRHYNCYIIITAQSFNNSISNVLKGNINMFFLYNPKTKKEADAIKELFDDGEKIDKALTLLKIKNSEDEKKKDGKRSFLYINTNSTPFKYFLNFHDELTDI